VIMKVVSKHYVGKCEDSHGDFCWRHGGLIMKILIKIFVIRLWISHHGDFIEDMRFSLKTLETLRDTVNFIESSKYFLMQLEIQFLKII
jgi:hypothetical protein